MFQRLIGSGLIDWGSGAPVYAGGGLYAENAGVAQIPFNKSILSSGPNEGDSWVVNIDGMEYTVNLVSDPSQTVFLFLTSPPTPPVTTVTVEYDGDPASLAGFPSGIPVEPFGPVTLTVQ